MSLPIPLTEQQIIETVRCAGDEAYFIREYCQILSDGESSEWVPFDLWPAQEDALGEIIENRQLAILKARQLGLTWLVLAYILHRVMFRPIQSGLLFSLRETEASAMLDERLKGMYRHLPSWMHAEEKEPEKGSRVSKEKLKDNTTKWELPSGSLVRAFPANRGDSYTGTIALVDEADLIPHLDGLLRSVKPTIDAGGQLILLSRSDKTRPLSSFKRIYRAGERGANSYRVIFLPWYARPSRTKAWYDRLCADAMAKDGTLDEVYEQYPSTAEEALQPNVLDKRVAPAKVDAVYEELEPVSVEEIEAALLAFNRKRVEEEYDEIVLPLDSQGYRRPLRIYRLPEPGRRYVMGADPAEGNPSSDDSALIILDAETWEQVAVLNGKYEVSEFAEYIDALGEFYNRAAVLPERNNHGHALILKLRDISFLQIIEGRDGQKGLLTTAKSKKHMFSVLADAIKSRDTVIHDDETRVQIASISGATLKAPEGMHDDIAIAYCLALVAASSTGVGIMM